MTNIARGLVTLATLISLTGCRHEPSTDTVCLLDVSKSITAEGVRYEFRAANDLVDQMKRGDQLTIIPITGNAMSETPGHILHFDAPTQREPYDHDLTLFRQQAHEQIMTMQNAAIAHPSEHTDILGALDVAKQELDTLPSLNMKRLTALSDFIEDDGTYRFTVDKQLADATAAETLADYLQNEHAFTLSDTRISLNMVQSRDLRSIDPQRQRAVSEFWKRYFAPTSDVQIVMGAPGS